MLRQVSPKRASLLLLAALVAALAVALPLPSLMAQVHHKHEAKDEILALEQLWRQAQLSGDVQAMDKLLSDDYLGTNISGTVLTKAQQLDRMRTRKATITTLELSDIKVKLVGQIAIVTSLGTITSTGGATGTLNGSFRYTRIYQHLPTGAWKITNFAATPIRPGANPPPDAPAAGSPPATAPPARM